MSTELKAGQVVTVNGFMDYAYERKKQKAVGNYGDRPDGDYRKWVKKDFVKWHPQEQEVMLIGWTYKLEGTVHAAEYVHVYDGYDMVEKITDGGIDVENTVKVWVVQLHQTNSRYRKPFFVSEEQILEQSGTG